MFWGRYNGILVSPCLGNPHEIRPCFEVVAKQKLSYLIENTGFVQGLQSSGRRFDSDPPSIKSSTYKNIQQGMAKQFRHFYAFYRLA